jgi:hypothetical protein
LTIPVYNTSLPPDLNDIHGMISPNERIFLLHYTSKHYSGVGSVLNLGCWLGATTLAFSKGIMKNKGLKRVGKIIYAFDLFLWTEVFVNRLKGTKYEEKYFLPGDSYLNEFSDNLNDYSEIIVICGDIEKINWENGLIEFLLIDAMKSPHLARSIVQKYYCFLIPGKSMIYHQDFDHYLTPWVHILICLHKRYFKHIHDLPGSGGTVFLLQRSIHDSVLNLNFMTVDEKTVEKALKYCFKIAFKTKHNGIAAAHVVFYVYQRKFDIAFKKFTNYLWNGIELGNDFINAKLLLDRTKICQ